MYSREIFAHRLKDLLDKRAMTQRALAEKLKTTEVTVSRYVSGNRTPNIETTVEIADILGVSLNDLVGIDPPAKQSRRRTLPSWCRATPRQAPMTAESSGPCSTAT